MKYVLVKGDRPEHLVDQVNRLLDAGWVLYGNPYCYHNGTTTYHLQAMTTWG